MRRSLRNALPVLAIGFLESVLGVSLTPAQELAPFRQYEAVVIPLERFSEWLNLAPSAHVNLYQYVNGSYRAIPFQIDKRRKINLRWNTAATSGPQKYTDICEYGYFRELSPPSGSTDPFASDLFAPRDELVFMLADAGTESASTWVPQTGTERYQITLVDPQTNALRRVYLYLWNEVPPDLSQTTYVAYQQDPSPPPEDPCVPVPQSCGTVTSTTSGSLSSLFSLNVHFKKNWVTDGLVLKDASGIAFGDPLKRFVMSVRGENEDWWSVAGWPRFLGVKSTGRVRVVRGVQGAQSGFATTKYEFIYPTLALTRVNVRVHPLSWLRMGFNHTSQVSQDPNYLFVKGSNGDPIGYDQVDGVLPSNPPAVGFDSWVELLTQHLGSYEHLFIERRLLPPPSPSPTVRSFVYDESPLDDVYGQHGRLWSGLGNTQDGYLYDDQGNLIVDPNTGEPVGNDGGCPPNKDPESSEYSFGQFEHFVFPRGTFLNPLDIQNSKGSYYRLNLVNPVIVTVEKQVAGTGGPGWTPCTPQVGAGPLSTGAIQVNFTNCFANMFMIDRGEGAGSDSLRPYRGIAGGTSFVDTNVQAGTTYTYRVRAYGPSGQAGPLSATATALSSDGTPPRAPLGLSVTSTSGGAVLTWYTNVERDIKGYHVYLATSASGPFNRLTVSPYPAYEARSYAISGLQPGTYFVKATAIDFAGNVSADSAVVSFNPLP